MKIRILLPVVLLLSFAAAAMAKDPVKPKVPASFQNAITFCDQQYALCVKAKCTSADGKKNVPCVCDVINGWSMGPGSCTSRAPVTGKDGRTHIISTYANLYNLTEKTLSCPSGTTWAWCFGAKCVVDPKNPRIAVCDCPVKVAKKTSLTLGGNCDTGNCSQVWSAATPAEDKFANDYYFWYMWKNHLKPPALPPARDCAPPPAPKSE
ncbi:MAG TPA: hypothetical protein VN605_10560 [Thermoanaerobaculia bacterium]|nr:hypothetical protein [Thermoanaerobaculia bacterium]